MNYRLLLLPLGLLTLSACAEQELAEPYARPRPTAVIVTRPAPVVVEREVIYPNHERDYNWDHNRDENWDDLSVQYYPSGVDPRGRVIVRCTKAQIRNGDC